METNIFAMQVLQQMSNIGLVIERAYVGTLMTVLDHRGFHVSLIDLSFNSSILKYLDDPVKVPAWPRPFSLTDVGNNQVKKYLIKNDIYLKPENESINIYNQ